MDESRSEQLAEIREMLAEVQSEDRAAAAIAPKKPASAPVEKPKAPEPPRESLTSGVMTSASEMHEVDPRIAAESQRMEEARQEEEDAAYRQRASRLQHRPQRAKATDVKKLERSHSRRIKHEKAQARAGSGAFLTGFLLVVIIAAVMILLYVAHPYIIERMPGTEAAMNNYVATIDSMRVSLAETFGGLRDWISSVLSDEEG